MTDTILDLIASWHGHAVVTHFDRPTGAWFFVALHDPTLGRPTGGTRLKHYPTPAEGLRDALRLAEGMTYKWAALGGDLGGGKAVIALPAPIAGAARRELLERYAEFLGSLSSVFATGADLGTTAEDMGMLARRASNVLGVDYETLTSYDPGPYTARGVASGLRAAVAHVFGTDVDGRTVLIEGTGNVGRPLAQMLHAEGARLLLADLDRARAEELAQVLGGEVVEASQVAETVCDVYAPCAVGATLNPSTIPKLGCRIVAGSANNQLLEPEDADRIEERGIVYVPDYVINAGGALAFAKMAEGERDFEKLAQTMETIGKSVAEILGEARERGITAVAAAREGVERRLARARGV